MLHQACKAFIINSTNDYYSSCTDYYDKGLSYKGFISRYRAYKGIITLTVHLLSLILSLFII